MRYFFSITLIVYICACYCILPQSHANNEDKNMLTPEIRSALININNTKDLDAISDRLPKKKQKQTVILPSTSPSLEDSIGRWKIVTAIDENMNKRNRKICYLLLEASGSVGNYNEKRNPYLAVLYVNKMIQRVSIYADYQYRLNSTISVSVDGQQFQMDTEKDFAWIRDISGHNNINMIKAMQKSGSLLVRSESIDGYYAIDKYLLNDFKIAYNKMVEICEQYRNKKD